MLRYRSSAISLALASAALLALASCSTIGEGVTKAILDKAEEKPAPDSSLCEVAGPAYPGLAAGLKDATPSRPKTVRLIIVHGIGEHQPGYSQLLQHNLTKRLGLDGMASSPKSISLQNGPDSKVTLPSPNLGTLRISRYTNGQGGELLAFEVTWSDLFAAERNAVKFDEYGLHPGSRADLNASLKKLVNSLTEPLAYHGPKGELARASLIQAFCWAGRNEWADYPVAAHEACNLRDTRQSIIERDTFAIASHSLGSRIAIDSLMALGRVRESYARDPKARAGFQAMQALRDKDITFYMLANQLPLLQVGQGLPDVTGNTAMYCTPEAPNVRERLFKSLSIVAFSDPNDVLSYQIPDTFTGEFLDSRLCAATTNVSIAVANTVSLPGTSFASPEIAHANYEDDERVLTLMAGGLSGTAPPQNCSWLKTRDGRK